MSIGRRRFLGKTLWGGLGLLAAPLAQFGRGALEAAAPAQVSARAVDLVLGSTVVDSVSELHLDSLESFFAGIGDGRLGAEAAADEELFVDRENSVSFCTATTIVAP